MEVIRIYAQLLILGGGAYLTLVPLLPLTVQSVNPSYFEFLKNEATFCRRIYFDRNKPLALLLQEESAPLLRILHFSREAEATIILIFFELFKLSG